MCSLSFTFSIKWRYTFDKHNGPFQDCWLSLTQEVNRNAFKTLRRSIEWLPGNSIKSTMTKKIQRDGDSSGRFHHASCCTQLKSSVGCSVNDKSLSTWCPRVVCSLGCQSPEERSPSVGNQGWERPHVTLIEGRGSLSCGKAWFASRLPVWAHSDEDLFLLSAGKKWLSCCQKENLMEGPVHSSI